MSRAEEIKKVLAQLDRGIVTNREACERIGAIQLLWHNEILDNPSWNDED